MRSKLDANLAQVNQSGAEAEVLRVENERTIGFASLNLAMGVEGRSAYELEPVSLEMEAVEPLERQIERERWVAGLDFSLPVFTGFAINSRIDAASERLRAMEAARRELRQQVRHEVERAYLGLETARELARVAQTQATVAEATLRLASQRYGAQLGGFLELVQAEVSLTAAKQAHAQVAYDFKLALATLEYVVRAPAAGAVKVVAR